MPLTRIHALLLLTLVAACGGDAAEEPGAAPAAGAAADDQDVGEGLRAVTELGYAGFAKTVSTAGDGVVQADPARSCPGYTLCVAIPFAQAALLDAEGRGVHRWKGGPGENWSRARLLDDGSLIVLGTDEANRKNPGFLRKLTYAGDEVWCVRGGFHHDFEVQPDGTLLALTRREVRLPRIDPKLPVRDDRLIHLDADGQELDQFSLLQAAWQAPEVLALSDRHRDWWRKGCVDLLHLNSVFAMKDPALAARDPFYSLDRVMVSSRHQDAILVFDRRAHTLVWAWGPGEVEMQHDASVLPDGRILLFDNGNQRGWSRLLRLDPLTRAVEWTWSAPEPTDFFSDGRGTVQLLPDGNLLVGNTNAGECFELTPEGAVVWRYFTPLKNPEGMRGAIRTERYPAAMVEAILAAHR